MCDELDCRDSGLSRVTNVSKRAYITHDVCIRTDSSVKNKASCRHVICILEVCQCVHVFAPVTPQSVSRVLCGDTYVDKCVV